MPCARARSSWTASFSSRTHWSKHDLALGEVVLSDLGGEAQVHGEGHQALLGAVVDVPLDAPPLVVGSGHDAQPGGLPLVGLAAYFVE